MNQLLAIFTEPKALFDELKERPTFLVPLLLTLVITTVAIFFYYQRVDGDWMLTQMLSADPNMTAAKIAETKKVMSPELMKWIGIIAAPPAMLGIYLLIAVYFLLAGKMMGSPLSFKQALSLQCWSSAPGLLAAAATLATVLTMSPQTLQTDITPTRLDTLLFNLPMSHPWKNWLASVDLTHFWSLWLAALGWRQWTRSSWTAAITVSALPFALIMGGWALWIFVRN